MALSKSDIAKTYPLPSYNYRVEIAGVAIGFSEVSGLSISRETTTYKESPTATNAPGPVMMNMPSQKASASVSLKKGLVKTTSVKELYTWINSIQLSCSSLDAIAHLNWICDPTVIPFLDVGVESERCLADCWANFLNRVHAEPSSRAGLRAGHQPSSQAGTEAAPTIGQSPVEPGFGRLSVDGV